MTTEPLILAIDNGTQSVRALLFDIAGNLVGKGKQEIEPYFSEHPGWAEQHPEYFWQQLGHACARVWQATDAAPSRWWALPSPPSGAPWSTSTGTATPYAQRFSGSTNATPPSTARCRALGAGCSGSPAWRTP